ncbi:MAG: SusC/RagA family TonB-linked outer membrane protein [Gemmatimonadota bacterium]|nr:SusC/RagA family TonB-linked outer membrane protein [Gemmatimonadota bacterium]
MRSVKRFWIAAVLCAVGIPSFVSAQATRRVSGQVSVQGSTEPVSGATIQVTGTAFGATADESGKFSVSVPTGPVQLRVRRIGYTAKVVPISATDDNLSISLNRDVLQLETQVITGQATTVSSVNAANAVTVISSAKLNNVPAQTIDAALQGKVPGAIISTNSGAPGGGSQIQLRGVSTLNGSFQPLYVIDGVIASNATINNGLNVISQSARGNFSSSQDQSANRIADLNPNDIENIQVLKGPSAASIYGSRGTNGVIVITTKQGRAGKTTVDITQRFGASYLSNKLGSRCFQSGTEYAAWAASNFNQSSAAAQAANVMAFNVATNKCHDYEQEFYGNSPLSYQTVASVNGGTDSGTSYYLSGLVQHDNGLAPNDLYNKQSMRANLGQRIGSRLTIRANTELLHTLTQRGISGNDNEGISPYTIFTATPSFVNLQRSADGTFPKNPSPLLPGANPFQNADAVKTPDDVYRMIGSSTALLNLVATERQSLDINLVGAMDHYVDHGKVISPSFLYFEQTNPYPGTLLNSDGVFTNLNLNLAATHKLTTGMFTATTSGGIRQDRTQSDVTQITGRGLPFSNVTNVSTAAQTFTNEGQGLTKTFSVYAQEEFLTLHERLFLTAGVNGERNSNNGDPEKFYTYPKFSASYNMGLLPPFVDRLKFRLAFGRAGNQPTQGKYTFLTTLLDEGAVGARASAIKGAANIKPEIASETEGGFDATFFGGRMGVSFTQYRKVIDELLLQANTVPSTGFTSQWINGGQLANKGTEVSLDVTPLQAKNLTWTSTTTYSSTRGRVTRLPVPAFIPASGSFGSRFGNAWIQQGLSSTIIQAVVGCKVAVAPGASCSSANRIVGFAGDQNPDFVMGFSNNLSFGRFTVNSLLDWRKGGKVVDLTQNYFDGNNIAKDTLVSQQRLAAFSAGQPVYVQNATFLKLRELNLSYQLPDAFNSALFHGKASQTRVELSGRNLKTWTPYQGLDPEVSNFSNQALGRIQDVTPYPPSRSFFFSLNATF